MTISRKSAKWLAASLAVILRLSPLAASLHRQAVRAFPELEAVSWSLVPFSSVVE
jgi:hypothetical protein